VLSHPEVIASYLGTEPDTVARSGTTKTPARPRKRAAKKPAAR
jgi:hypothetical protein